MEKKLVNLWYNEEGDYLNVTWGFGNTYYTSTEDKRVMALVDVGGDIQGFKIDGLSTIKGAPLDVDLTSAEPKNTPEEIEEWQRKTKVRARGKVSKLWYDEEGDFLEVTWDRNPGYFDSTEDDRVMVNLDIEGNVQGFHILGFSTIRGAPLKVDLTSAEPKNTPEEIEEWQQLTRERAKRRQE
jgi:hypothetical protein